MPSEGTHTHTHTCAHTRLEKASVRCGMFRCQRRQWRTRFFAEVIVSAESGRAGEASSYRADEAKHWWRPPARSKSLALIPFQWNTQFSSALVMGSGRCLSLSPVLSTRNRSSLVKLCKRYVGLIVQIRLNSSYFVFWFSLDAQELFSAKLMIN